MASPFMQRLEDTAAKLPEIAPKLFHIRTETEGFTLIQPNAAQLKYHEDRMARGFAAHDVILKARKLGFSTWKELEGLLLAVMVDGFSGLVMGDDKEKTQKLFNIILWAYQRLPEDLKKARKLDTDRRDAIAIGGSTIYTATAGGKDPARGDTLHWVHMTEISRYPNPELIMSGVTEAMAESGRAAHMCRESTPAGRNFFYDLCVAARDGVSMDRLFFFEWWWKNSNRIPLEPGEVIIPTAEEMDVIQLAARGGFTLTPEQLKWRRWKNLPTELGARDDTEEAEFAQEHVEDFESAFLIGGSPIFNAVKLGLAAKRAEAQWPIEVKKFPNGEMRHWSEPGKYPIVIGVDVAEGLSGGDWSVINVWENTAEKFTQIARMKIKCQPLDLAQYVYDYGTTRYHNALVIVERNSVGQLVLNRLIEMGYPNLYYQEELDGNVTTRPGWYTSSRTKPLMIAAFKQEFENGHLVINDPELIEQMGNVQYDDFGKIITPKGKHDDIFMSACIAQMGREQAGYGASGSFSVISYV